MWWITGSCANWTRAALSTAPLQHKVRASGRDYTRRQTPRCRHMPSLEGMRNVQRLLKLHNPKIGEVKAEDIIDNRIMRKLEDSGFIERVYATYGAKL